MLSPAHEEIVNGRDRTINRINCTASRDLQFYVYNAWLLDNKKKRAKVGSQICRCEKDNGAQKVAALELEDVGRRS